MINIKNEKGLVRDLDSKAILSIDTTLLNEHRLRKTKARQMYENSLKVDKLETDIENLKSDMDSIKVLLNKLIELNTK